MKVSIHDSWACAISRMVILFIVAGMVGACASAKETFEEGTELEAEGRYAEAANRYIEALRKDRNLDGAREALLSAGNEAVKQYLERADRDGAAGRYEDAADSYFAVDNLVDRALDVDVQLEVPTTYAEDRRAVLDRAIETLMESGVVAENDGSWERAARFYGQILERFEPSLDQVEVAERSRLRALIRWGEYEIENHRYRSAYDRANEAIELAGGPDNRAADAAVALRARAVEQGTLFIAVFPIWRTEAVGDNIHGDLVEDLNDQLQLDFWSAPPLFIAMAEPALIRRELRELGLRRRSLSNREAGQAARVLGADLAVFGEIDRFTIRESDIKERVRQVETRDGQDTTFVEESGRLRYEIRVSYSIVDNRGREIGETTVSSSETGRFERGIYAGDYRDLKLSRGQRQLFEQEQQREREQEILDKLMVDLTQKLAESVYERLLREVE